MDDSGNRRVAWSPQDVRSLIRRHCQYSFFYLHLEPTNACNTRCEMCPRDAMTRAVKMMSWETFSRIANVCVSSRLPMVSIVGFGEPTLHPRLTSMIADMRARHTKMVIKLTTNGASLTPARIEELYAGGLDFLEVSFVGYDRTSYERLMRLDFDVAIAAVDFLKRSGKRFFITTFEMVHGDRDRILRFWKERGIDEVQIKGFHRRGGYLNRRRFSGADALGQYAARTSSVGQQVGNQKSEECHKLFMFLHVNASGEFIPCVQEINSRNVLFRIEEVATFDEVVSRMQFIRPQFDICDGCELKLQDHIDYYAAFLIRYFPDRIADLFGEASRRLIESRSHTDTKMRLERQASGSD